MKAITKLFTVDAVEWTGNNFNEIFEIISAESIEISYYPKFERIVIENSVEKLTVKPNDWIVKTPKGEICVYKPIKFAELFEISA